SFLAWAIVNNNQPVPDVFSKMTKIAASGRLGLDRPASEAAPRAVDRSGSRDAAYMLLILSELRFEIA
ncbi:hypothetical protein, partial [Novosphingobium sp. ST904]